jgi:hypothetical protein
MSHLPQWKSPVSTDRLSLYETLRSVALTAIGQTARLRRALSARFISVRKCFMVLNFGIGQEFLFQVRPSKGNL